MSANRTLIVCLEVAVLVVLGTAFVLLPEGWNLLALLPVALVIAALWVQRTPIRRSKRGGEAPNVPVATAATKNETPAAHQEQIPELAQRANRAFGPIAAGLIIDLVDLSTFGPVGLVLGLPIGGLAGYWMGTALGLSRRAALWCALAAGIYCTIPGTEFIPLATIVGACVRFRESARERRTHGQ